MGNTFEEILTKYFSYSYSGLKYSIIEFPDPTDYLDAGWYFVEYILTMDHVDKSLFTQDESLYVGIACSCAQPTSFLSGPPEKNHVCIFAFAQDIRQKFVTEHVPLFAPFLQGAESCSSVCSKN